MLAESRTYNLYLPIASKLIVFGVLAFLAIIGPILIFGLLPGKVPRPPVFVGIVWMGIAAWNWFIVLSIPHRILVSETGEITFQSVLRRRSVMSLEIESIMPTGSHFGYLSCRTSRGKITLLNQFDGFHEFITQLKRANPAVKIRGC